MHKQCFICGSQFSNIRFHKSKKENMFQFIHCGNNTCCKHCKKIFNKIKRLPFRTFTNYRAQECNIQKIRARTIIWYVSLITIMKKRRLKVL